jgi:hypothetical protein
MLMTTSRLGPVAMAGLLALALGCPPRNGGGARCPPARLAGDLASLLTAVHAKTVSGAKPGSDAFVVPDDAARDAFASAVVRALDGDAAAACSLPPSYRFGVVAEPGLGDVRIVAELDASGEPTPKLFWGTYAALVVAPGGAKTRRLAIEAPHPVFDKNTAEEAFLVMKAARARHLLVAGAHRCTSTAPSGCSGATTACSGSTSFAMSDAAHSVRTPFFAVHAALSDADAKLLFLQLHGNAQGCPAALVSDCSGAWPAAGPSERLAAELAKRGVDVGRCGAGHPTASCNLCGETNVEARRSAGSASPCTSNGTSYGRVVHVEQLISLRDAPARLIDAVSAAFDQE